jgi:hypothetical protein
VVHGYSNARWLASGLLFAAVAGPLFVFLYVAVAGESFRSALVLAAIWLAIAIPLNMVLWRRRTARS